MKKAYKISLITAFAVLLLLLVFLSCQGYNYPQTPSEIVGKNTFTQTMVEADGNEANFFASGDEKFNYLHDKDGYILLRDNGYLVYARNDEGRPQPTKVRYAAGAERINSLQKMVYSDINFSANPDLIAQYPQSASAPLLSQSSPFEVRPIVNIVIYVCFAGENVSLDRQQIDSFLSGPTNSLTDYYQRLSNGKIMVHNINPLNGEQIYIYKDSQPRSYYQLKRGSASRAARERTLLNNAVTASRQYFQLQGLDIDSDDDGFVDAVNFLIAGSPYSEWGGMLWPHSWDLDDISSGNSATISGLKVKKYSFNFLGQLTVGLLAHEFAHVLGVPDLYHYDDAHVAVGNWDLMHFEADNPQYMTTHLRYKYLKAVEEEQIGIIDYNGIYSLKPTTLTSRGELAAYRINSSRPNEYFMVEYRNNNVTGYDSSLPGSGLIVYRIKQNVTGNSLAKKNDKNNPDELYIFRPRVVTTGTEANNSLANLNKAFLSPSNAVFSSLGASLQQKPASSYDPTTIYFTDGLNSGIVINSLSINDGEIVFEVRLSGGNSVDDDYFVNKISLKNAGLINNSQFSGVYADMTVADGMALSNMNSIVAVLKTSDNRKTAEIRLDRAKFILSYDQELRNFAVRFIINDKGNHNLSTVFYDNDWKNYDEPSNIELYVVDSDNDMIKLASYSISQQNASWQSIQMTNTVFKPSVSASLRMTIGIRNDGKAFASSIDDLPEEIDDVIAASAGAYHMLILKSDLKVTHFGSLNQNENNVGSWANIIKVAAGEYTSYGLDLMGRVFYAGSGAAAGVAAWTDIIDISAGNRHVAGVKSNGRVEALGTGTDALAVGTWENITAVACGNDFTVGLTKSGTVIVTGNLANKTQATNLRNITKIAAGDQHMLALDQKGRVFAIGQDLEGNCDVSGYYDIIDIAAGNYQSVMLREDGKIFYAGVNTNSTNDISQNLIYFNNDYVDVTSLLSPFEGKIMKTGESYFLNVAALPQNATYKKITYKSSDTAVAEVTEDGVVTAKGEGVTVIDATHRGSSLNEKITITVVAPYQSESMIAAGDSHSVILGNNGTVTAAGANSKGQLNVNMWGNIKFVAAGGDTTVGITPDGGIRVAGELQGIGAEDWTSIKYVSVSKRTIVGINSDGVVFAVGDDNYHQVSSVEGISGAKKVTASPTHTVITYESNVFEAYGNNNKGQLGVKYWRNILQVVACEGFTLGLSEEGYLLYAGYSPYIENMSVVSQWYDIVAIDASADHIVAVDNNGKVYAAGNNSYAQSTVGSMTQVGRIAAGGEHTVGINFDGTISAAGRNNDSRLVLPAVNELPRVNLESVNFSDITFGVRVGQTKRSNLVFRPYNATDRKSENISYSSNLSNIATVDSQGNVTGIAVGEATITARITKNGGGQNTVSMTVYVYDTVQSINFLSPPTKNIYGYKDKLDLLGGKINIDLGGNKSFITTLTPEMVVGFDTATSTLGDRVITVREYNASTTFPIKVVDTVKNINISNMANMKTVYDYGDAIDLSGGWIGITRGYGNVQIEERMDNLLLNGSLEVFADTNILATTTVTLKYTDKIAAESGISNIFYLSYQITVFDKVIGLTAELDKTIFKYGEEIFGNGRLIVNMKSGIDIYEDIQSKEEIEEGVDSVITIGNYDKNMLGAQIIKINYFNPDFDIPFAYFPTLNIEVQDSISEVEITSMMLDDAAVYDRTKSIDSSITVRVSFSGGAIIDVGYDGAQQMFANIILAFGEVSVGDQEGFAKVSMEIKVLERLNNNIQHNRKYYDNDLKVLGLGSISSLKFVGGSQFDYGQSTDLMLEITTDNAALYRIKIDDARLGLDNKLLTPQTVSFTLLGETATTTVTFKDYVTGIYTQYLNISAIYGQALQLTVYKTMASGAELEITDGWDSNYIATKEGMQQVTITYLNSYTYTINVTVLNAIASVSVISSPRTTYQIHEDLDLSDFSIRLTFQKGDNETVPYALDKFSVTGFDKNLIGIQIVTITFDLTGDYWEYAFEVRNRIKRIEVDRELSKTLYTVGEDLDITLICVYENGDRSEIFDEFVNNFDKSLIGQQQVVNVIYWGTYSTALIVEIIDAPREITIKAPTKKYYEYGEPLDLDGGVLTIITQTGKRKAESLIAYRNYISTFNPTPLSKGGQQLTLTIPQYEVSAGFIVYVKDKATSIMLQPKENVTGIKIDRNNTRVLLDESTTLATFNNMISSYATISYKSGDSYLDLNAHQNDLISSGVKVEIRNSEGALLETFSINVKGDANGDGLFDDKDLPMLGQTLLLGTESALFYADYDSDREYTLTDFVNWVKRAEENQRGNAE